jgi:hypothetical protein
VKALQKSQAHGKGTLTEKNFRIFCDPAGRDKSVSDKFFKAWHEKEKYPGRNFDFAGTGGLVA